MLLAALLLALPIPSLALSSCAVFDASWNLLLFGVDGKDFSAPDNSTWDSASSSSKDITTTGRPPFTSLNVTCYLSQFSNAIYVLNSDQSNPSDIYIYDAAGLTWSTQKVDAGDFDPTTAVAILDHDTNVFYAMSKGELYSLDMGSTLSAATGENMQWQLQKTAELTTTDGADLSSYQPTMALAQNHVHFLGVPGLPDGSADIFVIHFSFFQPEPQSYGTFPNKHGQAASISKTEGVQTQFAFVPDTYDSTYIVDVNANTTVAFPAPPSNSKETDFALFGSPGSIVYLSSSTIAYMPYTEGSTSSEWKSLNIFNNAIASAAPSGTVSGGASGTGSASGASPTGDSGSDDNGAMSLSLDTAWWGSCASILLGVFIL